MRKYFDTVIRPLNDELKKQLSTRITVVEVENLDNNVDVMIKRKVSYRTMDGKYKVKNVVINTSKLGRMKSLGLSKEMLV